MTDFFGRLAERLVRPGDDLLRPGTPSRFEPPPELLRPAAAPAPAPAAASRRPAGARPARSRARSGRAA